MDATFSPPLIKSLRKTIMLPLNIAALRRSLSTLPLLVLLTVSVSAQTTTTSATDGMTPSGLAPGSPAGSYALSGSDNVNLFNGNLNFRLPLLGIGGRGSAAYQMTLALNVKSWHVKHFYKVMPDESEINSYSPTQSGWTPYSGYGAGKLTGRHFGLMTSSNFSCTWYSKTLSRLTFSTADGTEFELRDQLTDGQPLNSTCTQGAYRGAVFVTADGSSATFISDTAVYDNPAINVFGPRGFSVSGYLMLRDGTRFRIDAGSITWMRDGNGNQLSFAYDANSRSSTVTDSLNRQVTINYDVSDIAPYGLCDQIIFKGFGGAQRIIRVSKTTLGNALRPGSGYSIQTLQQLFPELNGASSTTTHNPTVVSAVWMPDGRRYQLFYNSYGELAKYILPTGGAVEYDMTPGSGVICAYSICSYYEDGGEIYRRVIERRVYPNGSTLEGKTVFAVSPSGYPSTQPWTSTVTIDQLTPTSVLLARAKHYFKGNAAGSLFKSYSFDVYSDWDEGHEYRTEAFAANGTTVLRRVDRELRQRAPVSWWSSYASLHGLNQSEEPPNDPRIVETIMTLVDTNQVSKQSAIHPQTGAIGFDQYNNPTDVYEYGYGTGAAGTLVRRTHTDYITTNVVGGITYNYDTDTSIHLRSLPEQTSVYDAAGVEQARTTFEYDNYTVTANHAPLVARSNISGLDAAFTTANKTRGNATANTSSLLTNGAVTGSISAYQQYDVAGNVVKVIDGRGNATTLNFADRFGAPDAEARLNAAPLELTSQGKASFAFPTYITNAMNHTAYAQRDYYTGQVVDAEDPNGVTSSAYYNDDFDRPTQVIRAADDATLKSQTSFSYDDTNRIITATSDLDTFEDQTPLKSQTLYDGLGRTIETRQYDTATAYVTTKQTYDALGRVEKVSNPYRSGQTVLWTTTTYDVLGRVTSLKTPDNATVTTSYIGNNLTVTDQAGKDRQSITDALGRLTQVIEDPGTGGLGYVTTYAYDVLANLKTVTQGVQTRTFTYDSLSRLKSAVNPESGTTNYTYDNSGNLLTKTDARSIVTTFTYDTINRPTLKNYSDTTPDVRYFYDAQTLPAGAPTFVRGSSTGRLVAVTTGGTNAGSYYGYDALGQSVRRIQRTDSVNYLVDATYNKAGSLTTETYPVVPGASDRRTVSYTLDLAGRLASLTSLATTYAPAASISTVSYAPHGGLTSETFGNNLIHAQTYNNRLQPTQIKLGTAASPTSVMNLTYNYGTTTNNGNVQSITYAGGGLSYTQTFGYDQLNRLTTSQEGASWSQTNSYDRYGNRSIMGGGLTFNANNNRITTAGYTYDAAGNLTDDSPHAYTFDAENKIIKVDNVSAYVYDGEGQRVRKLLGENLRFVYDMGGKQIAEFDGSTGALKKEYIYGASGLIATIEPTAVNANGTRYTTSDHLGSPRVITDASAIVKSRHDYMPFGEELFNGGRTTAMGYGAADGLRPHFTSHERDIETGLDYFEARYYASTQGRFTSVDPITVTAERIVDPQQLNLYAYVRNNPLAFIDPTGMIIDPSRLNEKDKGRWEKIQELINAKDKAGNYLHPELKASYDKLQADERTFYLQGGKLGSGDAGKFEIETFKGDNDFSAATITLDFSKIKNANVSEALFGGFKQFEGLRTNEERFTEVAGHEFTHATDAIDTPAEAVRIQKLINETTPAILAANKARMPLAPDLLLKIAEKDRLLEKGERSAYGAERRMLQELRASQKKRK
jgi:RHS repeat-associated protein